MGARLLGLGAAILMLLLTPGAAEARRAATLQELTDMAASEEVAPRCVVGQVSTVDPTYGTLSLAGADGCPEGDGYFILSRDDGQWGELGQVPADDSAVCPDEVPNRVGYDLRLCRKPRTYIMCLPKNPPSDFSRDLRSKPSRCLTLGPMQSNSEAANWAGLRWRGWGRGVAHARGFELGLHLPYAHIPARLFAYRLRRCPAGDRIYTRIKVRTKYGGGVLRFPASCSD